MGSLCEGTCIVWAMVVDCHHLRVAVGANYVAMVYCLNISTSLLVEGVHCSLVHISMNDHAYGG